jgi:hypothetical protein
MVPKDIGCERELVSLSGESVTSWPYAGIGDHDR